MQRQSLGSPATKQPAAEEEGGDVKKKYKKKIGGSGLVELEEAREEIGDSDKSLRRSSIGAAVSAGLERSIHVIPLLTLFCFLVLYICSHDPAVTGTLNLFILDLRSHIFRGISFLHSTDFLY